ncbi:hypothetical protein ACFLQ0_04075 [Nitrospinota bacterium]
MKEIAYYQRYKIQADITPTGQGEACSLFHVIVNEPKGEKVIRHHLFPPEDDPKIFFSESRAIEEAVSRAKNYINRKIT